MAKPLIKTIACDCCGQRYDHIPNFCEKCGEEIYDRMDPHVRERIEQKMYRLRSGLATASFICGLGGLITCFPVGLLGLVLGIVALIQISKDKYLTGKGLAIAGIVLGSTTVALNALMLIVAFG